MFMNDEIMSNKIFIISFTTLILSSIMIIISFCTNMFTLNDISYVIFHVSVIIALVSYVKILSYYTSDLKGIE